MLLRKIFALQGYHEEVTSDTGHTGGGEPQLNIDVSKMSDDLSADLLGDTADRGSATPSPEEKERLAKEAALSSGDTPEQKAEKEKKAAEAGRAAAEKAAAATEAKKKAAELRTSLKEQHKDKDLTKLSDDEVLKLAPAPTEDKYKAPPKSLKAELAADYEKLPPTMKAHLHEREEAFHRGIDQYRSGHDYGAAVFNLMKPYEPLLNAQGVKSHIDAVKYLMNSHYQLSTGDEAAKAAYLSKVVKNYGISLEAITKAYGDEKPIVDPAVKALQDQVNGLLTGQTEAQKKQFAEIHNRTAIEVKQFAEDPAHPYFDEVADHIMLLMANPKIDLKSAYESAVWANPVTRAKEQARLKGETEAATRKAAEEEAAKAAAARGTVVRGRETTRGSSQSFSGTLDDALKESYAEIKARDS